MVTPSVTAPGDTNVSDANDCGSSDFRLFCSCDLDLDPMTFIYELNSCPRETYTGCMKLNFLRQGFRKLSCEQKRQIHSYIHTYTHTHGYICHRNYTTPLRGWSISDAKKFAFHRSNVRGTSNLRRIYSDVTMGTRSGGRRQFSLNTVL